MRHVLRLRAEHHRRLAALLRAAMPSESVSFLLCRRAVGSDAVVYLADEVIEVAAVEYAEQQFNIASVAPPAMARVAQRARERGRVVVMAHLHPMTDRGVHFSAADHAGNRRSFAFLHRRVPQPEHIALVWNADIRECRGLVYPAGGGALPLDAVNVVDGTTWQEFVALDELDDGRFARQAMLLGAAGQRRLSQLRIVFVGAGGTGSLASTGVIHHGIRHMTVIDDELLALSNLPRVLGSQPDDVGVASKTEIAARYALMHAPNTKLIQLQTHVEDPVVLPHLVGADFIVCCTDNTTSRAHLNQVAHQYLVPLLDIGVQFVVNAGGQIVNEVGRVNLMRPGTACLCCTGHVDPARLTAEATPSAERRQVNSYMRNFDDPQPSMLAFNMEIVGRALQVLVGHITGLLVTEADAFEQRTFLKPRGGSYARQVAKRQRDGCWTCGAERTGIGADEAMHMRRRAA